jgi:hypothetical protein
MNRAKAGIKAIFRVKNRGFETNMGSQYFLVRRKKRDFYMLFDAKKEAET